MRKILTTASIAALVIALTGCDTKSKPPAVKDESVRVEQRPMELPSKNEQMITGTVRYIELEGGFYELVADDGEKYDPLNLPAEYRKDGLRVKFQISEKKDIVSFHMRGKIVEVVRIENERKK